MSRILLFLMLILVFNAFGVKKKIIYEAPYGTERGEYKKKNSSSDDEVFSAPRAIYVCKNKLLIADLCNRRVPIIDIKKGKIERIIKANTFNGYWFEYVNLEDSVLLFSLILYKIQSNDELVEKKEYREYQGESFDYFLEHSSGYKILETSRGEYFLDSSYNKVNRDKLPDAIAEIDANWYFKDEKVIIGEYITKYYKKKIKDHYFELGGEPVDGEIPPIFPFPDSTEGGEYFTTGFSRDFIGYDTSYNRYCYSHECDSVRVHENTFSDSIVMVDDPKYGLVDVSKKGHYKEEISIVSSYDKLGQLRFWFPEPPIEDGWKKAANPIFVSREGRIFRMIFYSHKYKSEDEIDEDKGIRVIEYIPEKKDFTHEGRVELYGDKD